MITANYADLMRQASLTAAEYMEKAIQEVEKKYGENYAANHPELIVAFMNAAVSDYQANVLAKEIGEALQLFSAAISSASSELSNAILIDK